MESIRLSIELPHEFEATDAAAALGTFKRRHPQDDEDKQLILRLETLVSKHTQALAYYKGELNERRRGINTILPKEVLSTVFYHHSLSLFHSRGPIEVNLGWLKLAHVCRYWRSVLLRSPAVFSFLTIPAKNEQHLQTCLQYSRNAPLHVKYDDCSDIEEEQWPIFAPHFGRSRFLSINRIIPDVQTLPLSVMLTTLKMTKTSAELKLTGPELDQLFSMLPNLESLDSDLFTLGSDWLQRTFPSKLVLLSINHADPYDDIGLNVPIPIEDLVSGIRQMTRLRVLKLVGLQYYLYTDHSELEAETTIQPLQYLSLRGDSDSCISILSSVESAQELDFYTHSNLNDRILKTDAILTTLIRFLERSVLICDEPYTLLLDAVKLPGHAARRDIILRARPTIHGPMVPSDKLPREQRDELGYFQFDISIAMYVDSTPTESPSEHRDVDLIPQVVAFYQGVLPLLSNFGALILVLEYDCCIIRYAWDTIAPMVNNIQSLQLIIGIGSRWYRSPDDGTPLSFTHFPLRLCKTRDNNLGVCFPALQNLSMTVQFWLGHRETDRGPETLIDNLRNALETRAGLSFHCETLTLRIPGESDVDRERFIPLARELVLQDMSHWPWEEGEDLVI